MSRGCLKSAKLLMNGKCHRRSISSAYYAVYCMLTAEMVRENVAFPADWNNPAHNQLSDLVLEHPRRVPKAGRYRLRQIVIRLRRAREDADYRPRANIDNATAVATIRDVYRAYEILEVEDE